MYNQTNSYCQHFTCIVHINPCDLDNSVNTVCRRLVMNKKLLRRLRQVLIAVKVRIQGKYKLLPLLLLILEKLLQRLWDILIQLLRIICLAQKLKDSHIGKKYNMRALLYTVLLENLDKFQGIPRFFKAFRKP